MTVNKLQHICLEAEKMHEESFSTENYNYSISKQEAATKAVEKAGEHLAWAQIVYFLINSYWNDIQQIHIER